MSGLSYKALQPGMDGQTHVTDKLRQVVHIMQDGAPVIRHIETACSAKDKVPAIDMCIVRLSHDMTQIRFDSEASGTFCAGIFDALDISTIEQVAASNLDKHAVGLLIPEREIIIELIFASEEDWKNWLYGLEILCANFRTKKEGSLTPDTSVSDDGIVSDLLEMVEELKAHNEALIGINDRYELSLENATRQLQIEKSKNANLYCLLSIKDSNISELSNLVTSLLQQQSILCRFIRSIQESESPRREGLISSVDTGHTTYDP
jgi:hypothetical protein